jgi:hypothetical protein
MNVTETTSLLAMIAAYDNRDWDQATVAAWGMALSDVSFEDAKAAVVQHFRESTDYFKPAHITAFVKAKAEVDAKFMADAVKTARGLDLVKGWPETLSPEHMQAVLDWRERNNAKYRNTPAINDGTPNNPIQLGEIGRTMPEEDR